MLTTIGKSLVYFIVILSITGLGISLWAVADKTDFGAYTKKLGEEGTKAVTVQGNETAQLKELLAKYRARDTKIARGPDEIASNKDLTIKQALEEADKLEGQLRQVFANQDDIQARINLVNDLQSLREKLRVEKETGNELRLVMNPDEARARLGQRSYRDIIASLQVAKDEAEKRTEAMQPDLYNSAIRLQNLQQRLKGLQERAKDLGVQ